MTSNAEAINRNLPATFADQLIADGFEVLASHERDAFTVGRKIVNGTSIEQLYIHAPIATTAMKTQVVTIRQQIKDAVAQHPTLILPVVIKPYSQDKRFLQVTLQQPLAAVPLYDYLHQQTQPALPAPMFGLTRLYEFLGRMGDNPITEILRRAHYQRGVLHLLQPLTDWLHHYQHQQAKTAQFQIQPQDVRVVLTDGKPTIMLHGFGLATVLAALQPNPQPVDVKDANIAALGAIYQQAFLGDAHSQNPYRVMDNNHPILNPVRVAEVQSQQHQLANPAHLKQALYMTADLQDGKAINRMVISTSFIISNIDPLADALPLHLRMAFTHGVIIAIGLEVIRVVYSHLFRKVILSYRHIPYLAVLPVLMIALYFVGDFVVRHGYPDEKQQTQQIADLQNALAETQQALSDSLTQQDEMKGSIEILTQKLDHLVAQNPNHPEIPAVQQILAQLQENNTALTAQIADLQTQMTQQQAALEQLTIDETALPTVIQFPTLMATVPSTATVDTSPVSPAVAMAQQQPPSTGNSVAVLGVTSMPQVLAVGGVISQPTSVPPVNTPLSPTTVLTSVPAVTETTEDDQSILSSGTATEIAPTQVIPTQIVLTQTMTEMPTEAPTTAPSATPTQTGQPGMMVQIVHPAADGMVIQGVAATGFQAEVKEGQSLVKAGIWVYFEIYRLTDDPRLGLGAMPVYRKDSPEQYAAYCAFGGDTDRDCKRMNNTEQRNRQDVTAAFADGLYVLRVRAEKKDGSAASDWVYRVFQLALGGTVPVIPLPPATVTPSPEPIVTQEVENETENSAEEMMPEQPVTNPENVLPNPSADTPPSGSGQAVPDIQPLPAENNGSEVSPVADIPAPPASENQPSVVPAQPAIPGQGDGETVPAIPAQPQPDMPPAAPADAVPPVENIPPLANAALIAPGAPPTGD
jgi:hypothetical protein